MGEFRSWGKLDRLALAGLLALTAWALMPSLRGEFVADDYVFLATSRMVDAPWRAFWQRHFYEPLYFRPIGLVVWWLSERCFGLNYAWHAALNATLHLANVALLWVLLRRLASGVLSRIIGVGWFALGPLSFPAVLWLSDRFDLLALFFLLLILMEASAHGRVTRTVVVVFTAGLAACWSKEWAFAACFAVAMGLTWVAWRSRGGHFASMASALLVAIVVAWSIRASVLDGTTTSLLASSLSAGGFTAGSLAWVTASARIVVALGVGWWVLTFAAVCVFSMLFSAVSSGANGLRAPFTVASILALLLAISLPQTLTVVGYTGLIDTGIFGAATTTRFFYGSMATLGAIAAMALSSAGFSGKIRGLAIAVSGICILAFAIKAQRSATEFSVWTHREIAPFAIAATAVTDAVAKKGGEPCVAVFVGTQLSHPYSRMFSDVTVKARTKSPEKTWACHVMTESTPWLFAFPSNTRPVDLPLRNVPHVGNQPKPDSSWGGILYRYRLPANDLAALPNAHFFDWQAGHFDDITEAVRRGDRKVKTHDW